MEGKGEFERSSSCQSDERNGCLEKNEVSVVVGRSGVVIEPEASGRSRIFQDKLLETHGGDGEVALKSNCCEHCGDGIVGISVAKPVYVDSENVSREKEVGGANVGSSHSVAVNVVKSSIDQNGRARDVYAFWDIKGIDTVDGVTGIGKMIVVSVVAGSAPNDCDGSVECGDGGEDLTGRIDERRARWKLASRSNCCNSGKNKGNLQILQSIVSISY